MPSVHTYAEYLALEASSNVKHEFLGGQIYAMAGGTPEHAALASAVAGLLFAQLRGTGCRSYDSDLRVRTRSGLATYPDVTIICGPTERDETDSQAVTNPVLIIEVLSRSTEAYDAGDKFEHYKTLPSLRQYVLVSHREPSLEVWTLGEDGWSQTIVREGETAELSIGARLDVRELYESAGEPAA
jgi:Uma2 family endonuclease